MSRADSFLDHLYRWLGVEVHPVTHKERLVAILGGLVAIPALFAASSVFLHAEAALPLVASMGASAVLLFASPHGPFSQPWPLLGGHVVSALVGVTCASWTPHPVIAAALAVGLSIGAMHYLRCIHPPGGATALVAVIGGPAVTHLGYQYVLAPVALNAAILCLVAIHYNAVFPWRRYPAQLHRMTQPPPRAEFIRHEDFVYALSQIDTYIDVSEDDLLRIYDLAMGHARPRDVPPPPA
jgi:CBS-domain-containing membrane protein